MNRAAFLAGLCVVFAIGVFQQRGAASDELLFTAVEGQVNATAPAPAANLAANLAIVATPSTSFVSGHETLEAINDGLAPTRSDDTRHGA